jgi:hypothetical protein
MTEPSGDVPMEDGYSTATDQYLPDLDGSNTAPVYDGCFATEQNMYSFEQLSTCHYDMFPAPNTNLLIPLEQSWVPDQHALESDMFFLSPNMHQYNNSAWMHHTPIISTFTGRTGVHEPVRPKLPHPTGIWMYTNAIIFRSL